MGNIYWEIGYRIGWKCCEDFNLGTGKGHENAVESGYFKVVGIKDELSEYQRKRVKQMWVTDQ